MIRHYSSGIYLKPFYKEHELDLYSDNEAIDKVGYNVELLTQHYHDECDEFEDCDYYDDYESDENDERDEWVKRERVENQFWKDLSLWCIYFEPLVFDEEAALRCGLTPFTYDGKNMLALSGCGMDLSPKLDAYQALTYRAVDKHSKLFSDRSYFEYVVGSDITQQVLEATSTEACTQ